MSYEWLVLLATTAGVGGISLFVLCILNGPDDETGRFPWFRGVFAPLLLVTASLWLFHGVETDENRPVFQWWFQPAAEEIDSAGLRAKVGPNPIERHPIMKETNFDTLFTKPEFDWWAARQKIEYASLTVEDDEGQRQRLRFLVTVAGEFIVDTLGERHEIHYSGSDFDTAHAVFERFRTTAVLPLAQ
ncbi:hypothetical protein [Thioalkalivibrio sp. ALE16]|uniref:hypothetical protein n=1 Tax=Thioalkalivibrio sp. ALE16 TaxID=1158172 RepID=UPI0003805A01|nr:hypothetical protein [Thioalkalivibrio sp. ALE16]